MLFNDPFSLVTSQLTRPAAFVPAADLLVSNDDLVLTMDLPGFTSDDVSIDVQDNVLTVRGERKRPQAPEGTSFVHVERPFGSFERRITVPKGVDADGITASLDNGVLSLIVHKPEQMKPKTITIDTGSERKQVEAGVA